MDLLRSQAVERKQLGSTSDLLQLYSEMGPCWTACGRIRGGFHILLPGRFRSGAGARDRGGRIRPSFGRPIPTDLHRSAQSRLPLRKLGGAVCGVRADLWPRRAEVVVAAGLLSMDRGLDRMDAGLDSREAARRELAQTTLPLIPQRRSLYARQTVQLCVCLWNGVRRRRRRAN
jgi:hypothetical protein